MGKTLKYALFFVFFLPSFCVFSQVRTSPVPSWVRPSTLQSETTASKDEGGYHFELFEKQYNLPEKTIFSRFRIKVLTVDGIQQNSDIYLNYDPSYQTLTIHEIKIIRGGREIDKLDTKQIKTIQRETGAMQHIYDGSLSALLHLTDVQKQDVIEYSYSLKGFNPVNKGHFSGWLYHQIYVPVERFHHAIITEESTVLHMLKFQNDFEPRVENKGGQKIYVWENTATKAIKFDSNIPYWDAMYPMTTVSTFSDWREVVDWALPMYPVGGEDAKVLAGHFLKSGSKEEILLKMIRAVQDEVRYLGLESGMSAYKPNAPKKVWEQKFGDCKDKSLLMANLMQEAGVEAYPMLVNTEWRHRTNRLTASQSAFDHCVVAFKWEGEFRFIDPTISDQGGSLDNIHFPNYGLGLILKKGESRLTELPKPIIASTSITELIEVKDFGGKAEYTVRTEYRGRKADDTRSFFANGVNEDISQEYLNFYNNIYPGIFATADIKVMDYSRNGENLVTVEEYYEIPEFWTSSETGNQIVGEVYPLVLQSMLGFPASNKRTSDYFLGEPESFSQSTQLVMPENWPVKRSSKTIDAGAFVYKSEVYGAGNTTVINHSFELLQNSVPSEKVAELLKQRDLVKNDLGYSVSRQNPIATNGNDLNILAILLTLILLGVGGYFAFKIYRSFDPDPWIYAENKTVGGWLILPAIGLMATPIYTVYEFIDTGFLGQSIWNNIQDYGFGFRVFVVSELVVNIAYILFTVLVIAYFIGRRTGTPQLMIIFYITSFVLVTLDSVVAEYFFPDLGLESDMRQIFRSFVAMAIWIPYFYLSERVKSTFCKTFRRRDLETQLQQ